MALADSTLTTGAPGRTRPSRSPHPPVAVVERVDGLELGMCHGCLDERRVVAAVDVAEKVVQQAGNLPRRWRHEGRTARVVGDAADPVLLGTDPAAELWCRRPVHHRPVDHEQVTGVVAPGQRGLCAHQPARAGEQALDHRGPDRLGAAGRAPGPRGRVGGHDEVSSRRAGPGRRRHSRSPCGRDGSCRLRWTTGAGPRSSRERSCAEHGRGVALESSDVRPPRRLLVRAVNRGGAETSYLS
jgi:hypothetical protein